MEFKCRNCGHVFEIAKPEGGPHVVMDVLGEVGVIKMELEIVGEGITITDCKFCCQKGKSLVTK